MPANTTRLTLPYPVAADTVDVPRDVLALANALDGKAAMYSSGTFAARPAASIAGRVYHATDLGVTFYDTGSAWQPLYRVPMGGALPASPVDGQEFYYQCPASPWSVWHLRYNAAWGDGFNWDCLGGSPLIAEVLAAETGTSGTGWANLATDGPRVTFPLKGIYRIGGQCNGWTNSASPGAQFGCGAGYNGAVPADNRWIGGVLDQASIATTSSFQGEGSIPNANDYMKLLYLKNATGTITYRDRHIWAMPRRVG